MEARLDRPERHLEHVGDLLVGQTVDVAQQDDSGEVVLEVADRGSDHRLVVLALDLDRGLEAAVGQVWQRLAVGAGRVERPGALVPGLTSPRRDRLVHGDPEQPREEPSVAREAVEAAVCLEEDLLRHVERQVTVVEAPVDEVVHALLVALDEGAERLTTPSLGPRHQGAVVERR